ncbi:hypothetical protein [Epibacterium ulvae]|uniref:hypothetical protein n=1 Tax=Epibacterium ulvae TaxID=1156985 RepID=UPI002491AAA0|nr:hypothetical protein [Epibacterium ulvae]
MPESDPIATAYLNAITSLNRIRSGAMKAIKQLDPDSPAHTFFEALKTEAENGLKLGD